MPTWNLRVDNCAAFQDRGGVALDYSFARGALGGAVGGGSEFASIQEIRAAANITDEEIRSLMMKILLARALIANINAPSDLNGHSVSLTINAGGGSLGFA